jgi:tetratricopeptide (TPR) repeat protein
MTGKTVALILGASTFPRFPGFAPSIAFRNSASGMRKYFESKNGINVADEDILDLFDSPERWVDQDEVIRSFLDDREDATDIFFYYVGHGYFAGSGSDHYLLACQRAEGIRRELTGISVKTLAATLNQYFRNKRIFAILDCCFAGAAIPAFQSPAVEVAQRLSTGDLPPAGTALLLASPKDSPAISGAEFTAFSGALLDVLINGVKGLGPFLSLADTRDEVYDRIQRQVRVQRTAPQVFAPSQPFGDLSRTGVFPNPAYVAVQAASPSAVPPVGGRRTGYGRLMGLAVLALILVVVGSLALERPNRRHPGVLITAPPPPDLAEQIRKVEAVLEDGDTVTARRVLESALSARPKDARVRYMLGRVAYAEDRRAEALDDYREAIALDPGFRGDPVLLGHIDAMLADPKEDDAALDLLIDHIGAPAADLLAKVANEGSDLPRRRRAATALADIDQGKRVDRVSMDMLELKKAPTCEEKKDWVGKLSDLGDQRALPALRGLRARRMGPISWGGTDVGCMKKELSEAIRVLEKGITSAAVHVDHTTPTAKAPPAAPSSVDSRHLPSEGQRLHAERSPDNADVWKSAAAYSASSAAKSVAEADKILRQADGQLVRVRESLGQHIVPTFAPSQTGWQMDAPQLRLEDWRALTKPGHQQPTMWSKYEYRIVGGDLVFTELNDGKVFYRTPVGAPDYGDRFTAAVQTSMAPQLKAEMNRSD